MDDENFFESAGNRKIYNDSPEEITYSRRIARYLSKYNWYFPAKAYNRVQAESTEDGPEEAVLDVAWEYFEHIGLPRCFKEMGNAKTFDRAEPGEFEEPTMLYPLWKTPIIDMGDFGIGIGLYFYTLKFFAIITFIAGLINIPALVYVNSPHYNPDGRNRNSPICTNVEWQPCPTCKTSDWDRFPTRSDDRFAQTSDGSLTFIKVNGCKIDDIFGISTYASLVFIIGAVYTVNYLLGRKAIKLDEAEQTAKDYSIQIKVSSPYGIRNLTKM